MPKPGVESNDGFAPAGTPASPSDGDKGIRLQVLLARAGLSSRRGAEEMILSGRVSVNGKLVRELGTRAFRGDDLTVDGRPLPRDERKRYILLNKPPGYLCALIDPESRPLAVELLKPGVKERVYNIGRLDQWSTGLVLFTNDGDFAALIGHPSGGLEKEYVLLADGPLEDGFFRSFETGLPVDGELFHAKAATRTGERAGRIILVEGKNREIRRALESIGRRALSLRRVRIGPLTIDGLGEGSWRELDGAEVLALRRAAGKAREEGKEG